MDMIEELANRGNFAVLFVGTFPEGYTLEVRMYRDTIGEALAIFTDLGNKLYNPFTYVPGEVTREQIIDTLIEKYNRDRASIAQQQFFAQLAQGDVRVQ